MALATATVTAINLRFGEDSIAQMTNRSSFDEGDSVDLDVLEQAHTHAMKWVTNKIGTQAEDDPTVIDAVPIFLQPPGAEISSYEDSWERRWGEIKRPTGSAVTSALAKGATNDRRVLDSEDWNNLQDTQARSRPGRSGY